MKLLDRIKELLLRPKGRLRGPAGGPHPAPLDTRKDKER